MSENEKKVVQIMRGIALIMVVFHHVLRASGKVRYDSACVMLSYIHVQTFFVISGFLFEWNYAKYRQRGFSLFNRKKATELVIPYLSWTWLFSLLLLGCMYAVPSLYRFLGTKGYFAKSIVASLIDPFLFRSPYFESLWFIYTLYVIFLINWVIQSKYIKTIGFVIAAIAASFYSYWFYEDSPLIIYRIAVNFQWFYLGRLCAVKWGDIRNRTNSKKMIATAAIVFVALTCSVIWDPIALCFKSKAFRAVLYSIQRTAYSISGLIIIYSTAKTISRKKYAGDGLKYLGDKSYGVYLIHNPWLVTPFSIAASRFMPSSIITEWVVFFIVMSVSLFVGCCLEKNNTLSLLFMGRPFSKE